jgi:hypothetical protein
MKKIFDLIHTFVIIALTCTGFVMACVLASMVLLQMVKPIFTHTTTTSGRIVSMRTGPFEDCVNISQSLRGETLSSRYCIYDDLQDGLYIGQNVRVTYHQGAWLFMDTLVFTK